MRAQLRVRCNKHTKSSKERILRPIPDPLKVLRIRYSDWRASVNRGAMMEMRAASRAATLLLYSPAALSPSQSARLLSLPSPKLYNFSTSRRTARKSRSHGFSGARMSAVDLEPSMSVKKKAFEISNELKGTSIFLVGMNCSMKTNVGKLLADALRYYYFDSDGLVEQAAGGETAAKSLREADEKGFRDSETEVLKQLSSMGRLVVCAGDGAVQSSTNLALMRHGISIWIDVPLDILANEKLRAEVPITGSNATSDSDSFTEVLQGLSKVYNERRDGYGTADAIVSLQKVGTQLGYEDLSTVTAQDMAVEALTEIERLTRVKKMMEAAARPF